MEKIMLPLGRRLKELRKERKLKQKEMARFLECTDRNYQKMEYGEINVPGLTLNKRAHYFMYGMHNLLGAGDHGHHKKPSPPPPAGREEQGKAGGLILAGVCLILCRMNIQAISQSNLDPSVICLRIQALPKEKPKCTVIFLSRAPG